MQTLNITFDIISILLGCFILWDNCRDNKQITILEVLFTGFITAVLIILPPILFSIILISIIFVLMNAAFGGQRWWQSIIKSIDDFLNIPLVGRDTTWHKRFKRKKEEPKEEWDNQNKIPEVPL